MKIRDLKDKKILVLGLGQEGLTTLDFLARQFPDKKVAVADQKETHTLPSNVDKSYFGKNYLDFLENYEVIIKSPGIANLPKIDQVKQKGVTVTSATAIFFENCRGKIIGVTGTKGKSTTSTLIYDVLKNAGLDVYLVGNIGVPALQLIKTGDKNSLFVFELSSYQLSDLKLSPHIAVITNIYPEHLNYHGNLEQYKLAKSNITKYQEPDDYLIYNQNIQSVKNIASSSRVKNENQIGFSGSNLIKDLIGENNISSLGNLNPENVAPAIIIGRQIFKISDDKTKEAIVSFKPLPHRLEFIGEVHGIKFYNDSLATIPQATSFALDSLHNVETLIAGGFDRNLDYTILGPAIAKTGVKNLILFPDTGQKIWQAVVNSTPDHNRPQKFEVNSMKEAVKIAFKNTKKGGICLLSPASASFNMFKDYADRGNQFKKLVQNHH